MNIIRAIDEYYGSESEKTYENSKNLLLDLYRTDRLFLSVRRSSRPVASAPGTGRHDTTWLSGVLHDHTRRVEGTWRSRDPAPGSEAGQGMGLRRYYI